ncbi:MAG: hypothetical protein IMF12_08915 [Proteobacteria bacterium]|nr:hypothetical protein [Pseudomonadota bacterium]
MVKILHKLGLSDMFDVKAVAANLKSSFIETQQLAPSAGLPILLWTIFGKYRKTSIK